MPTARTLMAAVSGLVAAGVALAVGELPAAVVQDRVGLVRAVGNEFVDRYAASLKDLAVQLFGTQDKVALIVGIALVSLAAGAVLGIVARRSMAAATGGFAFFGAIGLWSVATDPAGGGGLAVVSAGAAVVAGVATLRFLVARLPEAEASAAGGWGPADDPRQKTPDRRAFLAYSGAAGVAAVLLTAAGGALRGRTNVEAQRRALVLPRPARSTPVPTTGLVEVEGVSPYVTPNRDFYRIDTALLTPQVDADGWLLRVSGLVDRPYELTLPELLGMDVVEEPVTLACVSNEVGDGLVGNAVWLGVPLATILERARPHDDATQVVGRSTDGFTAGFPTEVALDGRIAMVAVGMNGEPLPAAHGYPARLVVAGLYGYVSATKWLTEIELTRLEDFDGYWVPRGWAKEGPVKTQSRIDVPRRGADVRAGSVAVAGVAWAPSVGIDAVEVQVDDGRWEAAELGEAAGPATWVQWVWRWDATPGEHTLRCRATDATGATQPAERQPPRPDGATGHHWVRVTVQS